MYVTISPAMSLARDLIAKACPTDAIFDCEVYMGTSADHTGLCIFQPVTDAYAARILRFALDIESLHTTEIHLGDKCSAPANEVAKIMRAYVQYAFGGFHGEFMNAGAPKRDMVHIRWHKERPPLTAQRLAEIEAVDTGV